MPTDLAISKLRYSLRLHFVCVSLSLNGIYHILTVWQEPGCRLQGSDIWQKQSPASWTARILHILVLLICISHWHAWEMVAKVSQLLIRAIN